MKTARVAHLRFGFKQMPLAAFSPLLQNGFRYPLQLGLSLKTSLCRELGISAAFFENRVQTIFLNGEPVDDPDAVFVKDGDCIALSAAMPGLAGATLRCGGPLVSFRSTISHHGRAVKADALAGLVTIKLFNLLIRQLGPLFLAKGILLPADTLRSCWQQLDMADCRTVELDGQAIMPASDPPPELPSQWVVASP